MMKKLKSRNRILAITLPGESTNIREKENEQKKTVK
jgi:hypothetical protein